VARQRAAEILGFANFSGSAIKWPDPEPELIREAGQAFVDWPLAQWESISPAQVSEPEDVLPEVFLPKALVCYGPKKNVHFVSELGEGLYQIALAHAICRPQPCESAFRQFCRRQD
jgi:hypothetical protein